MMLAMNLRHVIDGSGRHLVETMERLGHSTPTASLRYQGHVSGRAVEIAEALSAQAISRIDPLREAAAIP